MESDLADLLEPHSKVEFDGAMVLVADFEPGYKPVSAMISYELPDEARSKAFATMCRMCADAADLGVAVERQALAAHRDQFAIRSRARGQHHLEAFQYSFKKGFRHVRITLPYEPYRFARAE